MSLFFFGNNFYKNKETFKIFSPQLLEVYRILLVETTLESIMFYCTFSVTNTMFFPCTALLCYSTTATRALKLSTTLLGISCGNPSDFSSDDVLSCPWIVFTNCLSGTPSENSQVEILGLGWPGVIVLIRNESVPWEVIPEVFKCSVRETRHHLIS